MSDMHATTPEREEISRLQKRHGRALRLATLVDAGVDCVPLPGAGHTLVRWQQLAAVAAHDLSLVKLFEGHTDALAILAELHGPAPVTGERWATWCAEPPDARVTFESNGARAGVQLHGTKSWCSGAASVTHAVVSGWNAAGEACLAAVALDQPGVTVTDQGWHAVGMAGSGSVDVRFDGAEAVQLGVPGDYTRRAGFWHGGAGVAACWYGGACGIALMTRERSRGASEPHRLAHLGAIDVALSGAAALLREAAHWIDAQPDADAHGVALRVRLGVERAAEVVMHHAGRAVGAGPLCRDARFAQAMADLPVFLRQSHAERDLAALGIHLLDTKAPLWTL
ncbi:acyl-CoA dehydrogenase [Variovorax sp. PAMC 28711]|nr:acyl-CoA dehydrogenase [Variovorax sp. PAMC 28711]